MVDRVVNAFNTTPGCDYASNTLDRTYPRGLDTEVLSNGLLQQMHREAQTEAQREHVTPFIYQQPERFQIIQVTQANGANHAHERWTVDTPEDFELIQHILNAFSPEITRFSMADVLALLDTHPQWRELNAHIEQKKVGV